MTFIIDCDKLNQNYSFVSEGDDVLENEAMYHRDVTDMLVADEIVTFALGYGRSILRAIVEKEDRLTAVQFNALVLVRRYGPLSPSELARIMRASKQQITQIVSALEKQRFIQGAPDQNDRRTTFYTVTQEGEAFYHECISIFAERVRHLFNNFTEEDQRSFLKSSKAFMDLIGYVVKTYG